MATNPKLEYSLKSTMKLNNGVEMPRIQLGVYMTSGKETSTAVAHALRAGYLAIDSAEWYANESKVGTSILSFLSSSQNTSFKTPLERKDIWFTTKLKTNSDYETTRRKIKESVVKSGLGYIDLYLLHSPYGGREKRMDCWRAVEDAIEEGEVRVGGVSNYGVKHLQELLDSNPRIRPAVNQIEVHPFNTQVTITSFCASNNIAIQAYAPLAKAMRFSHSLVKNISSKYGCTPAQLLIRWGLQKGYCVLPKSVSEERIRSNGDVGGFHIEEEDMRRLDGCDEGLVTDWDPTDAD